MMAIIGAILIGMILPVQTTINSKLRHLLNSPIQASFISFWIGTMALLVLTLINRGALSIQIINAYQNSWWLWIGGVLGVIYLTTNILLFPLIGPVQTVLMPVFGQIMMGLLIDSYGWFEVQRHPLTIARAIGGVMVLAGVVCSMNPSGKKQIRLSWFHLLGIIAGMLGACQSAINGRLGIVIGSTIEASLISFFVGSCLLTIILLITWQSVDREQLKEFKIAKKPRWLFSGGLLGAMFVLGNVIFVPKLGIGLTVVLVLLGQILSGYLVQLRLQKALIISRIEILGIVMMVFGICLVKFA